MQSFTLGPKQKSNTLPSYLVVILTGEKGREEMTYTMAWNWYSLLSVTELEFCEEKSLILFHTRLKSVYLSVNQSSASISSSLNIRY